MSNNTEMVININSFSASGSIQTTTGSISANSKVLTLNSALDFENGQGIQIYGAGAQCTNTTPTNVKVTQVGTVGTSTYGYRLITVGLTGSVTAATAEVITKTGNATLSSSIYNSISFSAADGYVWGLYRTTVPSGSSLKTGFLGFYASSTSCYDKGTDIVAVPDWLPSTPPNSATYEPLITTITSGGGTTSLTLNNSAIATVSNVKIIHDDTPSFVNAITYINSLGGGTLYIPNGNYNIRNVTPCSYLTVEGNSASNIYQIDTARLGVFDNVTYPSIPSLLQNVTFKNIQFYGATLGVPNGVCYQEAIRLMNAKNVVVTDCTVNGFLMGGISVSDSLNVWIERNKFYNIGAKYSNYSQGLGASGNAIDLTSSTGDPCGIASTGGSYYVRDNLIDTGLTGGIVIQAFAGNMDRAVVTGNIVKNYTSWAGIYVECGYGKEVIISENQCYECSVGIGVSDTSGTTKTVQQMSDIIISNNIIKNTNTSNYTSSDAGIVIEASKINLTGNLVEVFGQGLVYISVNNQVVPAKYFNISGNTFISINNTTSPQLLVYMQDVSNGNISNNTFTADDNCYQGGIWIDGGGSSVATSSSANGLLFSNNIIKNARQMALIFKYMYNSTISNNLIADWGISSNGTRYGIYLSENSYVSVISNTIKDSRSTVYADTDIYVDSTCTNVYIENNILGSVTSGVSTSTLGGLNGTNNVIAKNNEGFYSSSILTPDTAKPVSGTMYQNNKSYAIEVYIPVYATTNGTNGSVTVMLNNTSTTQNLYTDFVSGSTSSSIPYMVKIKVPPYWYYGVTVSGCTIGTAKYTIEQ